MPLHVGDLGPLFHSCLGPMSQQTKWHLNRFSLCCIHTDRPAAKHTHAHTHLTALFPGLPGWAGTRKVKAIWILLKQETVSGSGISWAICKSAPRSGQITTPAPHHSVFYRPDALPAAQPTVSKHWRQKNTLQKITIKMEYLCCTSWKSLTVLK